MPDRMTAHNYANEEMRALFPGLVIESIDFGHAQLEDGVEDWQADDVMRVNTNCGPIVVTAGLIFGPRCVLTVDETELKPPGDSYPGMEIRAQLKRGPQPDEGFFRMKVTGMGETRWFNVTPKQLALVASILERESDDD